MYKTLAVLGLVFGVGALGGLACGDGDGGGGGDCKKACATAASLKCANETEAACNTECSMLVQAAPNCKSQLEALISCTAARPASDFQCDADGESELKDGVCESQTNAAFTCILGGS